MALASPKDEEPAGFSVSQRAVDQDMEGSGSAAHGGVAASNDGSPLQQSSLSLMDLAGFSNEAHSSTSVEQHHNSRARDSPSNHHGRESTDQAGPVVRHSRGAQTASHAQLDTQLRLKRAASIRRASLSRVDPLRIAQSASGPETPGPPSHGSEVPLPAGAMDLVAAGTLAGAGRPGYRDGELMHALFDEPGDACLLPGGAVLVADMRNSCLRVVRVDRGGAGSRSARPRTGRGTTASPSKAARTSGKDSNGEGTGGVFPGEVLTLDSCSLLRPRAPLVMGPSRIVLVCDSGHHKIRMLQLQEDINWMDGASLAVHDSVLAGSGRRGHRDGPADRAEFDAPSGLCLLPDGSILVSDTGNHCIRRIAGRAGRGGLFVSTVAGAARGEKGDEQESVASVQQPEAAGKRQLPSPDRSQLFQTAAEHQHKSKSTSGGRRKQRWRDGNGSTALFHRPESMVYDAVSGLVLVADVGNSCVRAVLPPSTGQRGTTMNCADPAEYEVTTVAGCPGQPGHKDGPGPGARFGRLGQLALAEDGSILVADGGAGCIRGIVQSSHNAFGEVKTVAGVPHTGEDSRKASSRYKDGTARRAKFGKPAGLCVVPASSGCLLVSDATNNHLRVLISRQASRRPPRAVARSLPPTADRTESTQMPARQSSASVVDSLQAMGRGAAAGSHAEGSAIRALLAGPGSPGGFALGTLSFRRGGGSGGTVGLGSGLAGSMRQIAFGLHEDEAGIDLVSRLQASVRALGTSARGTSSGGGAMGVNKRAFTVAVHKEEQGALVKHIANKLRSASAHNRHRHGPAEGPHRGAPAAMQSAPVLDHLGIAVRGSLGLPGQPRVLMSSHVRRTAARKSASQPGTHSAGSQASSRMRGSTTNAKQPAAAIGESPVRERPAKPLASALLAHQVAAARASRESPAVAFGKTLPADLQLASPRTGHESGGTPGKSEALAMKHARDSLTPHSRADERGSRALAREFVRANSPESQAIRQAQQHAATADVSEEQRAVSQSSQPAPAQEAAAGSGGAGKGSPKPASSPTSAFVHPSVRGMPGDDAVQRTRTAMRALAMSSPDHKDVGPEREELRDSSLDSRDEEHTEAPSHAPKESPPSNDCVSKVIEDAITFVLEQAGDEPSQSDRDRAEGLHQRLHQRLLALNLDVGIGSEAAVLLSSCSLLDMVDHENGRQLESGKRMVPGISDVTRILRRAAQLDEQARLGKDSRAASSAQPTETKPPVGPRLAGNAPRPVPRPSHSKVSKSARGSASAESSELSWSLASDAADVAAQDTTKPACGLPRYQQPTVAAVQRARSSGIRMRPDSLSYGWRARHRGTASWVEASEKEARKTGNPTGKRYSNGVSGMTPEAVHTLAVQRLEGTRGPGGRTLPDTKSASAQLGASGHLMTRRSVEVQQGTRRGNSSALVRLPSRHDHSSEARGLRGSAYARHDGEQQVLGPSNREGPGGGTARAGGISPTHVPIDHPRDAWIKQAPLDLEVVTTPAFATRRGGGHVGIEDFVEHAAGVQPAYAGEGGELRSAPPAVDEHQTRRHFVQSHAAVQAYHPAMQLRPHEADMRRAVAGAASRAALGQSGRTSPLRQVQSLPAYSVPSPTKVVGGTAQGGRRVRFAP